MKCCICGKDMSGENASGHGSKYQAEMKKLLGSDVLGTNWCGCTQNKETGISDKTNGL